MGKTPVLGFVEGGCDLVADLDRLMEFGVFVEGTSRSGKTNLVRVFLEQTYGAIQHIVLDPEGEYATLRSVERPYLVIGKSRDIELPADAEAIKRFVLAIVEKGVSVIIDLSEHDTEDQHRIVAAVCDALVSLPENHPGAAAVVIEEMQEYAPEGGGKGTALASVRRLSKRGLKRGFFIVGASQRVSDVSKGVVTMLKTKMIGGTDHKDAPRALEELGLPSRERASVTDLAQGEFWVKGPAFARHAQRVHVPRSTTAPPKRKRGEAPAPAAEAPAEIAALAAALKASVASAEPSAAPGAIAIAPAYGVAESGRATLVRHESTVRLDDLIQQRVDHARYDEAKRHERYRNVLNQAAQATLAEVDGAMLAMRRTYGLLKQARDGCVAVIAGVDEEWVKPAPPDPEDTSAPAARSPVPAAAPVTRAGHASVVTGAAQRILDAIAFLEYLGESQPTKKAVAALAGVSSAGGSWSTWISKLRTVGYVNTPTVDRLAITEAGRAASDRTRLPSSRRELHQQWLSKFSGTATRMLETLIGVYPDAMDKTALAAHVGVSATGGSWSTWLSQLRAPGLMEDVSKSEVRATSMLFPAGMP